MKNYVAKKLCFMMAYIIFSVVFQMCCFSTLNMGIFSSYWYIDFGIYWAIGIILFLLPMRVQEISSLVLLCFQGLFLNVISTIYTSTGRVFDIGMFTLAKETRKVLNMIVLAKGMLVLYICTIVIFIFAIILTRHMAVSVPYKHFIKRISNLAWAGCFVLIVVLQALIPARILSRYKKETYFLSDSFAYATLSSPYNSLKKFGLFGYYFTDLTRNLIPKLQPDLKIDYDSYDFEYYSSILDGLCEDDNVLFVFAESFEDYAINPELTPTLYALKNGVDLSSCGINEFYNVEFDENGERQLLRKDYTYNESSKSYAFNGIDIFKNLQLGECGLDLTNYKSYEATQNSELRILSGNYASTEDALVKILEQSDYTSRYIHTNYGAYYSREVYIQEAFGFDKVLYYDDMEYFLPNGGDLDLWALDSDAINHYLANPSEFDILPTDEKFLTFIMSITTHGDYPDSDFLADYYTFFDGVMSSEVHSTALKEWKNLKDARLKQCVRTYLSKAIDTELMVAMMVDELYNRGDLANTMIVLAADHYVYSADVVSFKYNYLLDKEGSPSPEDTDMHTIPCFIYSPKIKNEYLNANEEDRVVSHLTSGYDICPTIFSLAGVEFSQDHYIGHVVINQSLETGQQVYNKMIYSTTYAAYIDDYTISYDGYKLHSNKEVSAEYKEWFMLEANRIRLKEYYVRKMIGPHEQNSLIK